MAYKSHEDLHREELIEAIERAAHHISTAIKEGFIHMADKQAQALADLTAAITSLGDAIAAEIAALQAALSAAGQPDDSGAIEAAVTNLNDLAAKLKASIPPAPAPVVTPPTA